MKKTLVIIILLFLLFIVYFFILGVNSKSKNSPKLIDGRLSECPNTPNCACTENKDHAKHYISPINLSQSTAPNFNSLLGLKEIILNMGGSIQIEKENYISATFTSTIFRFVDDFEVRIDKANKVIHLRSASRVGRSDFGVNKKRIELFKKRYKSALLNRWFILR